MLILGASGLIGKSVLSKLSSMKHFELKASFFSNPIPESSLAEIVHVDLANKGVLKAALENIDTVVHLAGINITANNSPTEKELQIEKFVHLNRNLIEVLEQSPVKKIIWLSSTTGYPNKLTSLKERDYHTSVPHHRYTRVGEMFRALECEYIAKLRGVKSKNLIILRPSAVYGIGVNFNAKNPHVLTKLIHEICSECAPRAFFADPIEARDWIYVSDVASAISRVINSEIINQELNIASGETTSMFDLHKYIIEAAEVSQFVKLFPKRFENSEPMIKSLDNTKSKMLLGDYVETDIRRGIKSTIDWYRHVNYIKGDNFYV